MPKLLYLYGKGNQMGILIKKVLKLLGIDLDAMYGYGVVLKNKLDKEIDEAIDGHNELSDRLDRVIEVLNENSSDIQNILLRLRLNNLITQEEYATFYEKDEEQ